MTPARLFSLVLALGLLVAMPAMAADTTATTGSTDLLRTAIKVKRDASTTALKAYQSAKETDKLTKLIAFGDKSIDERTGAITEQEQELKTDGCPATALTAVNAAFATVSATLATQKIAVDAAKTTIDLKPLVKNVFQTNRVYQFLMPASRGACLSQKLLALINGQLADAVTKLKAAGIDTTAIETKLAAAKIDAQSAYDTYLQVVKAPGGGDTGNQVKMASAKTLLQSVRQALGDVKSDIGNLTGDYQQKIKTITPAAVTTTPATTN